MIPAYFLYHHGQRLRDADGHVGTVIQRRYVDRAIMSGFAEYAVQYADGTISWHNEADVQAVEEA